VDLVAACEPYRIGFLHEPANAISSAAFVVAGASILVGGRRSEACHGGLVRDRRTVFALLVVSVGVGSFIQHGPHPEWQAYAHDLPLATVLAFVATDAAADLAGRELSNRWWLIPSAAMVPVVALGATASTTTQAVLATTAIGGNLLRAARRPVLRRVLIAALVIAAAGATIGSPSDPALLCRADGLLPRHAIWHVLAAAALWRLATAIGARRVSSAAKGTAAPVGSPL
jgi:hypothetical protein